MRISDWSSDVCSSDLRKEKRSARRATDQSRLTSSSCTATIRVLKAMQTRSRYARARVKMSVFAFPKRFARTPMLLRSEEHTSELQSLMRISYAVFCLKKKKKTETNKIEHNDNNNQ